jgi:hypothetical protein
MSSNFHIGQTHVFTFKNPQTNPNIYLKAGAGETLVVDAVAQEADHALTADSATNAVYAENIQSTGNYYAPNPVSTGTITISGMTGVPCTGCSVSIDNNQMFIGSPGDTSISLKKGTISLYDKVGTQWVFNSSFAPPAVIPGCAVYYSYWGYSIMHKGNVMCCSSPLTAPSPDGTFTGVAIYRKISGTWTHQTSNTCGGTHCHTDGTYVAGWFQTASSSDIDICDSSGTVVRTIVVSSGSNDVCVHNGEVAVSTPTGSVRIYNISTGALVKTYSADSAFGYLVQMNDEYLVSVSLDKLSVVVVDRATDVYYTSFKMFDTITQIKLKGSALLIGYGSGADFFYDNGSIFFDPQKTISYTRSDNTLPYPSDPVWPKIYDWDVTTGELAVGEPLNNLVRTYSYSEPLTLVAKGAMGFTDGQLLISSNERRTFVNDTYQNPLDAYTATLYAKGFGSEKVYTGLAKITDTTASTSTSTGSLINAGGFGNAGAINTSTLTATSTTDSSSVSTGAIITSGGVGCAKTIYGNVLRSAATTASTSTSTGSIIAAGGIGCAGRVFTNDITTVNNNYCNIYRNNSITISTGVWTDVFSGSLGTVSNNGNVSGTTSGLITVSTAGLYSISYGGRWNVVYGGIRSLKIVSSGTWIGLTEYGQQDIVPPDFGVYDFNMNCSIVVYATASTTFRLYVYQDSPAGINIHNSYITVAKLVS